MEQTTSWECLPPLSHPEAHGGTLEGLGAEAGITRAGKLLLQPLPSVSLSVSTVLTPRPGPSETVEAPESLQGSR